MVVSRHVPPRAFPDAVFTFLNDWRMSILGSRRECYRWSPYFFFCSCTCALYVRLTSFVHPLASFHCWGRMKMGKSPLGAVLDRVAVRLLLVDILILILLVGAVILYDIVGEDAVGDAQDVEEPEEVERLEGDEEGGGDGLAERALVLLRVPVELEGADGAELSEEGVDDLEVDEVAEIDPDEDEDGEEGRGDGVVEVVKALGGGEEEVADVVGGVDCDADIRKMEAVAEGDEGEGDNVVADELLEVLAGPLHAEDEDDGLLGPVGALEEVVELDEGVVGAVGEALVHAAGVEVPDRGAAHDVHAQGPEDGEVDGRVALLHEAGLLALAEAGAAGNGAEHLLHDELAGEGEDDSVEGDKGHVPGALVVLDVAVGVELVGELVGEEDEAVERIGRVGPDGVRGEDEGDDDGG